jgi:hypothetical protein
MDGAECIATGCARHARSVCPEDERRRLRRWVVRIDDVAGRSNWSGRTWVETGESKRGASGISWSWEAWSSSAVVVEAEERSAMCSTSTYSVSVSLSD